MTRGRPRKTDPGKALEAAMLMFWEKGYEATSMTDLVAATGMAKPGLYASFGDKEELYLKALQHYFDELGTPFIERLLNSNAPPADALRAYLHAIADTVAGDATPGGCFVVNSATDCAAGSARMQDVSRELNLARRDALRQFFERAVARGDLPADTDTHGLADFYAGQSAALVSQAKTGASLAQLKTMADIALGALPD